VHVWDGQSAGPMFPNDAGKPMDLNNLVNRVIVPSLTRCAHCRKGKSEHVLADHEFKQDESLPKWHGWHAARRGLGTNLYRLGVPEKTIRSFAMRTSRLRQRITSKLPRRTHKRRWPNLRPSLLGNKRAMTAGIRSERQNTETTPN